MCCKKKKTRFVYIHASSLGKQDLAWHLHELYGLKKRHEVNISLESTVSKLQLNGPFQESQWPETHVSLSCTVQLYFQRHQ